MNMSHTIGLIGCGGIAGAWVKAVEEHDQCRIGVTFDLDAAAAARRAEETGARPVTDLDDLLGDGEIDLVVIGTPTPSHPDLVAAAAAAGKHVLCEKPMALDLASCRAMIEACDRAGVHLAIGHSLRFWTAFLACRRLVAAGAIGEPVTGSIDRMGTSGLLGIDAAGSDHWRDDVANSGGNVLEGYVHELDFTRAIFGEVASISGAVSGGETYGSARSPQTVQALVGFANGALVTMRTGSTVALPTRGYWIGGTEGGLRFTEWGGPVEHWRHDFEGKRLVECEATHAYYLELCDLLRAVEGGAAPENSGANGLKNVALGLGIYRSHEIGSRLECRDGIPLDLPEEYQNKRF
jgi:predicted dehydrogenase